MTGQPKYFTPKKLTESEPFISYTIISGNYFKVANRLRSFTRTGHDGLQDHYFVFPAVTMFVAAFEAFLQEHLAYALRNEKEQSDSALLANLKSQTPPYNEFKAWVKEIYKIFDQKEVGIDTNADVYHNLLALKELRNTVVHYNPAFIEHISWPARLEQALHLTKLEVINSGWVAQFSRPEVADWAYKSTKDAVEHFAQLSGAENPFTVTLERNGLPPWE